MKNCLPGFLYYGMAHLNLSQDEVWLMPFGLLMDLWECHRQFMGLAKREPKQVLTIDDVIPLWNLRRGGAARGR